MKRQTILLVIMLLLVPITAFMVLRGMRIPSLSIPRLMVSVVPSSDYLRVVLPCFAVALLAVMVAQYRYVRRTACIPMVRLLAYASCSALSGIALFVVYPVMWKCCWIVGRSMLGDYGNQLPLYAAVPLLTVATPVGGIVLVVFWCALQPVFLHSMCRRLGRSSKEKTLFEISYWLFTVFSWFVLLMAFGFPWLVLATMPHGGMCK